ncbi:MAG: hypothetical protein IJO50_00765, partial [Clostridia bacterium]|nr:hypothetical protein [Clostridia bacterium]
LRNLLYYMTKPLSRSFENYFSHACSIFLSGRGINCIIVRFEIEVFFVEEYFVYCQNVWWHFWIKPLYGLCFRKKEQGRFAGLEVLLPEACEDFMVLSSDDCIHVICQDRAGNILYLFHNGNSWHKATLLENKSSAPYPKHFRLLPIGKFLNLFYVIRYQERHMLVHQIPTDEQRPPTVIDYIRPASVPFLCHLTGTDITVTYQNEAGSCGSRLFPWSQKVFTPFRPIPLDNLSHVTDLLIEQGACTRYAAFQKLGGITNLVYFEKNIHDTFSEPVTVSLDCPQDACPVLCRDQKKLYLVWQEGGTVMSAHSEDDGIKWSKPIRYMKGSGAIPTCYIIEDGTGFKKNYGYEKDGNPVFYVGAPLSEPRKNPVSGEFLPEGHDVEVYARDMGANIPDTPPEKDPLTDLLKQELSRVKGQFLSLRKTVAELAERVTLLEEKQKESLPNTFVDTEGDL